MRNIIDIVDYHL